MPGLHPLSPRDGGRRLRVDDGVYYERAAGERQGRRGRRRGEGWMARCLLPIPLSPRHSCVCLYEDLSNSPSTPSPSPSTPRSLRRPPLVSLLSATSPFRRRGPRVMIVFVHLEDEVLAIAVFPRFYSRCGRCITAKCAISARSAAREERRG